MSQSLGIRIERTGALPRPRLFRLLQKALEKSAVVWVSGPAGTGKSTLIGSFLGQAKHAFRLCTLRDHDRDPAILFDSLLAAAGVPLAERVPFPGLGLSDPVLFSRAVWRRIFSEPGRLFVIDDEHALGEAPMLAAVVVEGVNEAISAGAKLVVLSRRSPPLALAARLGAGDVWLIEAHELSFSEAECVAWAKQRIGERATDLAGQLVRLSAGWALCLVLLVEHLRLGGEVAGPGDAVPDRLFGHLAEEVLGSLDARSRECLLWCVLLPHASLGYLRELSGDADTAQALATLEAQQLLCRDDPGSLPYVHPILADSCFRSGALWLGAEAWAARVERAATLLARAGEGEAALSLWHKTGRVESAAAWIAGQAPTLVATGRAATLQNWLTQLASEVREAEPWLAFWHDTLGYQGSDRLECLKRHFERFRARGDAVGVYTSWGRLAGEMMADRMVRQLREHLALLEPCRRELPLEPYPELQQFIEQQVVFGRFMTDPDHVSLDELRVLVRSLAASRDSSSVVAVTMIFWQAYNFRSRFDLEALLEEFKAYLAAGNVNELCSLVAGIGAAQSAYFWGDMSRLDREWDRVEALSIKYGFATLLGSLHAGRAAVAVDDEDLECARDRLNRVRLVPGPGFVFATWMHRVALGWYHCCIGRLAEARAAVTNVIGMADHDCPAAVGFLTMVEARVDMAEGLWDCAREKIDACLEDVGAISPQVRNSLNSLLAVMAIRHGQTERAIAYVRLAFAGMAAAGHFVVCGHTKTEFAKLCSFAFTNGVETEYITQLIDQRNLPAPSGAGAHDWPWRLVIRSRGPLSVTGRNGVIQLPRGKARELLSALVAFGGKDVPIEKLCDALWPDADGDRARRVFDTTLHRLRKALGDDASLELREQRLSLAESRCWLDRTGPGVLLEDEPEAPWLLGARARLQKSNHAHHAAE